MIRESALWALGAIGVAAFAFSKDGTFVTNVVVPAIMIIIGVRYYEKWRSK